ncbi:uncharacterized protein LOC119080806 [Bradysia coprophila]|uniref:uncharacterized protein LOC119080806 n=1 Tax=Bradysia coprophila TaxID=38358 RepID=UPI00187DB996|nr:uncharacterized protein LOC119080806 [Bradysia coprophila]
MTTKRECEFSVTICRVRTDNSWHPIVMPDCTIEKNRNMNFQHPFDCSKFYKCDQSRLIEKQCQTGYYWNQQSTACERESRGESTCEAAEPFRYGENRRNNAPVTRRHGRGCDKEHEDDTSAEKPLLRKRVSYLDDSNSSEMADSYGA